MVLRAKVVFGLACLLVACEKEQKLETTLKSDAGLPVASALDPDLAQAVAAASARAKGPAAAASGGPPANGIFAPGAADQELALGQPPKISLGSDGSAPKIALQPAQPKPGSKHSATIQVALQNDPRQGALPIDFGLSFEAQKPKGEEGMVGEIPVLVRVTFARVGISGAPKELVDQVAKLKGAKVEYLMLVDGAGIGFRFDVPKGTPAELGDSVRALSDTLAAITLPLPKEPVGVGAYWMATSREGMLGLDLVTYRLIKVERADPNAVTLSVNTKRYAANSNFDLPGLPPEAPRNLSEFQSMAEGKVELQPGKGFPLTATQNAVLGATLGISANPAERGTLEVRTRAELRPATETK